MVRDASKWGLAAAMFAGLAMVAFPWVDAGGEDAPMPTAFSVKDAAAAPLCDLLRTHDEVCQKGDVAAFSQCVTKDYLASMQRSLKAIDQPLSPAALRARTEAGAGLALLVSRTGCRGRAREGRACLLGRPAVGLVGSLAVAFVKEDGAWRIDRVVHQPLVAVDDEVLVDVVMEGMLTAR
jgi:hypothetical protein